MKRNDQRTVGAAKSAFGGLVRSLSEQLKASFGGLIFGYSPSDSYPQGLEHAIREMAANGRWQDACALVETLTKKLEGEQLDFLRQGRRLLDEEVSKMMSKTASFPEWRPIAEEARKALIPFASQFNGRIPNVEDAARLYNQTRASIETTAAELYEMIDHQGPEILRKRNQTQVLSDFSDVLKDLEVMMAASAEEEQQREKVA